MAVLIRGGTAISKRIAVDATGAPFDFLQQTLWWRIRNAGNVDILMFTSKGDFDATRNFQTIRTAGNGAESVIEGMFEVRLATREEAGGANPSSRFHRVWFKTAAGAGTLEILAGHQH